MDLRLRPFRCGDEVQARAAHAELAGDGFRFLLGGYRDGEPWERYLARLQRERRGEGVGPGRVPASLLAAEADGELVGRVSIRHSLNSELLQAGGHVGYGVRPQHRRRGYAREMLRQSLVILRAMGIQPVLVTCHEQNPVSARVIEGAGGVLEDVRVVAGESMRRYWIV